MPRLVWAFAGRTYYIVWNLMPRLINAWQTHFSPELWLFFFTYLHDIVHLFTRRPLICVIEFSIPPYLEKIVTWLKSCWPGQNQLIQSKQKICKNYELLSKLDYCKIPAMCAYFNSVLENEWQTVVFDFLATKQNYRVGNWKDVSSLA